MTKTRLVEGITILGLILLPLVVAAQEAPGDAVQGAPGLQAPQLCALAPEGASATLPDVGAQSSCDADCWDGSTQTCDGSTCFAVDSSCFSERGYCWSDLEGTKYCPVCRTSCPGISCDDLNGQFCQRFGPTCYDLPPYCNTYTCVCWNGVYACP